MTARAAISLSACVAGMAGAASALVPLPECAYDPETGTTFEIAGTDRPEGTIAVYPMAIANRFVIWEIPGGAARDYHPEYLMLQHCPTGQELVIAVPRTGADRVMDRWRDLIYGDAPYTMREIGEELAALGAGARRTENEFGSCPCDMTFATD